MDSATYNTPITFEDFRRAQRLYRSHRPMARLQMVVNISLAFICALGMFMLGVTYYQHADKGAAIGWWCAAAAMAVYGCIRWRLVMRRMYLRAFPKAHAAIPLELRWSDDQLIYTAPGLSESRFHWKVIQGVVQDENTVVLMLSKTNFIIVPRKAMPDEAMRDLIARSTAKEGA
jgi:hypothetical protein